MCNTFIISIYFAFALKSGCHVLKYCEHINLPQGSCICSTYIEEMFGDSDILKSLKYLEETMKVLSMELCDQKALCEQTHEKITI